MTGGWHGESSRHALAAKGIPTVATRVARGYHTARPLEDRIADEARVEPYTEDLAIWSVSPNTYDLAGVDDPVPEGYEIERNIDLDKGRIELIIKEKDKSGWVAVLDMHFVNKVDDDVEYYAFGIHVDTEHRGEGLSRYLLRHMINLADDMQVGIFGIITPVSTSPVDADILKSYYGSFGFTGGKVHDKMFDIVRPPQPKEGSLNE